jgi:2,3-dihydroxybenzoate decarboxylase
MPSGLSDRLTTELLDIHASRLQQMDENGVDLMVSSLVSAGVQGIADRKQAEALAMLANDRLNEECHAFRGLRGSQRA